jgi:hypothetical protein
MVAVVVRFVGITGEQLLKRSNFPVSAKTLGSRDSYTDAFGYVSAQSGGVADVGGKTKLDGRFLTR